MENLLIEFMKEYAMFFAGMLFMCATIIVSETGKIFIANIFFLTGDFIYLIYAIIMNNKFGIFALGLAIIFSIRTLLKMQNGIYSKSLLSFFKGK